MLYTRAVIENGHDGMFLSDGVDLVHITDKIVMYEKKTGYRVPKLLAMTAIHNPTGLRRIGDDLFMVSNSGGMIILYKNWQMIDSIILPDDIFMDYDVMDVKYYTNIIGYIVYDGGIIEEYIIDDDKIKTKKYNNMNIQISDHDIIHSGLTHITAICSDYSRVCRINKDTNVCKIIHVIDDNYGYLESSRDGRYLISRPNTNPWENHWIRVFIAETFTEIEPLSDRIKEVFGLIDGHLCMRDAAHVYIHFKGRIVVKHCADLGYIPTSDGLIYHVQGETKIKNTKWRWKDLDIQDPDIQELAIAIIIAIRRASKNVLNKDIIYHIATIVMENHIPTKS